MFPRVALDIRRRRRSAATPVPPAGGLPGDGSTRRPFLPLAAMHWDRSGHVRHSAPSNWKACPGRGIRLSRRHDGVGDLSRRTGATARGQVDDKVILGMLPVGPAWHPGYQLAARIGEGLPGSSVPIGGVAHGLLRYTGVGLALFHQSSAPRLGALPGSGGDPIGIHHNRRLEAPAAALVAVAHLRIMHRHHPVPAHSRGSLRPQLATGAATAPNSAASTIRCLLTVLGQLPLRLPRQLQQRPHNLGQQALPRPFVAPVEGCRSRWNPGTPPALPHSLTLHCRQPQQLDDPVPTGCTAPRPRMLVVSIHLHAPLFQVARLPGQPQAGLEYLPPLSCRISWAQHL